MVMGVFFTGKWITETQDLAKLLIDKNDQKWIQLKNNGLIVFDERRQGIKTRKLTNSENSGNLASNRVYSFAEDLEGEIWIGTDNGVSVFYDSNTIFQGENATQVVVTLGDYNSYLLEGQQINDIEIDGANRKWFATNNSGVIVTSASGVEEIYHFTTENSPLFSNKVLDIEMNGVTGEVFFVTEKGIISMRSESTQGNTDFSEVLVFPNPVKPDYSGPITIKGLITDAVVKITDVSGNLIYETIATGGQAVWDGKSFDGQKIILELSGFLFRPRRHNISRHKAFICKGLMHQSRAIVLRQLKYSETSLILKIYTEKEGLLSFIAKGVRGKKGKLRSAQFQPLNLIDLSYRDARKSELRQIIDLKVIDPFTDLPFNPVKRTIAIFIAELIQNTVKEQEPNKKLFEFYIIPFID